MMKTSKEAIKTSAKNWPVCLKSPSGIFVISGSWKIYWHAFSIYVCSIMTSTLEVIQKQIQLICFFVTMDSINKQNINLNKINEVVYVK